jgi:GH15 family glucan-1,4-alpha-glucosidase
MALRIEDYALIGDCETAALVGRDGSIDWLCVPRFDSGACFAALLGTAENGRWLIAPQGGIRNVRRRYRPGTLILETDFETDEGEATLVDFMSARRDDPDLIRIVVGKRGSVAMRIELIVRYEYGSIVPWVRKTPDGLQAIAGPDSLYLTTPVALHGEDLHTVGEFTVAAGQRVPFTLTWCPSHRHRHPATSADDELQRTEHWWRQWSDRCTFQGPWRETVVRSLITLKALTFKPTGGVVAAPTTSLPEQLGGTRNWDYRYCWLRDATFTLCAMIAGGYREEAGKWRDWLLRAVAGDARAIRILYGLAGERRAIEWEASWLSGYENSQPVRVGNAASGQLQLDVIGEVVDTMRICHRSGLAVGDDDWNLLTSLVEYLESVWRQPDHGIWEIRGEPRQFTHSKVMVWVAFDRAVKAIEHSGREGPLERWRTLRDTIHAEICREAFDERRNTFVQYYGANCEDAALLIMPLVGFLPCNDPRMVGTVNAVEEHLMENGFLRRYPETENVDGLPSGEGAFLACSFWYVQAIAMQGRMEEARQHFETLLKLANDVGLLPEEYDPKLRRFVGNFPQAFSHVGLINAACAISGQGGPAEMRPHG